MCLFYDPAMYTGTVRLVGESDSQILKDHGRRDVFYTGDDGLRRYELAYGIRSWWFGTAYIESFAVTMANQS
jgi:hypothetical protein